MPHIHRFYAESKVYPGKPYELSREEAHHGLRVLRLQEGEPVALFDGQGGEWQGRVSQCGKHDLIVQVESERHVEPPMPKITVALAWLMKDKALEFLVQHGTEAGVDRFCFFRGDRSGRAPRMNDKWHRMAIEACKQCGRLWLPEFCVKEDLAEALAGWRGRILLTAQDAQAIPIAAAAACEDAIILIGPEGDFSEKEISLAMQAGAVSVSLGDLTLRSEMAGLVAGLLFKAASAQMRKEQLGSGFRVSGFEDRRV